MNALWLALALLSSSVARSAPGPGSMLVPRPLTCSPTGQPFVLPPDCAIGADPVARPAAELLAAQLRIATGRPVPIVSASAPAAIRMGPDTGATLPAGGYRLSVTGTGVSITAADAAGFFHAAATIRQLLPAEVEFPAPVPGWKWTLPGVEITDAPQYGWRGFLIDSGRHFIPVARVKQIIDALALYKMNRLHWHLTDDQGWRVAIAKYPRLTSVGAWRGPTRYGGFYSRAELQDVVAYAAARGVTVVPEIELPGHAQAALAAYPDLGCTGGPYEVSTKWGVHPDVFCAGNDRTLAVLEGILGEVMDIFPSTWIHLGADEVPKDRWKACPKCQARIRQEGLTDEHALQSWFVHRVIRFVESRKRRAICWDEILEGGPPPGVIVQVWRASRCAVSAATSLGHEVIHSPYSHVYLDYSQEWFTLELAHRWNPAWEGDGKRLAPARLERPELLLGGEACMWGEFCPPERIGWMTFPRLLAVAEGLWSAQPDSFSSFRLRALAQSHRLASLGLTPGPDRIQPADPAH